MDKVANISGLKDLVISNFNAGKLNGQAGTVVKEIKEKAFADFEALGFPGVKNEEYKYTNFAPAFKLDYSISPDSPVGLDDIKSIFYKNQDAYSLVFVNGKFNPSLSQLEGSEEFVTVNKFSEAGKENLEAYFAREASDKSDAYVSLNTAYAENGVFINIKKGKVVDKPLYIYFLSDVRKENVLAFPRNIIVAEENSQAQIVFSFHTLGEKNSFTNIVDEFFVKKDANLDVYLIQNESSKAYHINNTFVHQVEKSHFSSNTITLDGAMVRNNLNILLDAQYSEAEMYGLYLLGNNQHVDNHTLVDHRVPNCYSNESYKGILGGKSTGVFNGKIYVKPDAQKTNAFQSNKNVLLSKDATMNTKPQLEIFADDVKCSHGATIGQLDQEPLFYLRSRGIREENAKKLLVLAFAQDVIEHIKIDTLKEALTDLLTQRIS